MELEDRGGSSPLAFPNSAQKEPQLSPEKLAVIARSLVISPDLDALLEHEDHSRAQQIVTVTELKTQEAQFPLGENPPTSETTPVGLPPPPRRTRQGRQNRTTEAERRRSNSLTMERHPVILAQEGQEGLKTQRVPKSLAHSLSSSASNPYINPAPNLQEILQAAGNVMTTNKGQYPLTRTTTQDTMETLQQQHDPRSETQEESRRKDSRPRDELPKRSSSQEAQQQSVSRLGSLTVVPRVDKLKLLSKISLSNSGDTRSATQNAKHGPYSGYSPSTTTTTTTSPKRANLFPSRGNNKGKTIKEKAVDPRTIMDARMNDEVEVTILRKHRPLLSHGQQSSISSIESLNSYGPPSTAENEPRISISSTIYPESSNSFTPSVYNNPSPTFDMNPYRDSFMEINSPVKLDANSERQQQQQPEQSRPSIDSQQDTNLSPLEFTHTPISERSTLSFNAPKTERNYGVKPPIPSAPKPLFSRTGLRLSRHGSTKGSSSSQPDSDQGHQLPVRPLTTNFLDLDERADLVRKSRKLARVFGQTPDGDIMAQQESSRSIHVNSLGKDTPGNSPRFLKDIRRHSMPLSPEGVSFLSIVSPTSETTPILSERIIEIRGVAEPVSLADDIVHQEDLAPNRSSPPTSFIDLTEDTAADRTSSRKPRHSRSISQSTFDTTTTSLIEGDDDRRRKRERLAKLHRFLGSRVPVGLVLGTDDVDDCLPPPFSPPVNKNPSSEDEVTKKAWLSRKRSSSTTSLLPLLDDMDRHRVELDDREKAINVRRAQKMEKVFGVAPPQTLYHTRHSASPSAAFARPPTERVAGFIPPAPEAELIPFQRNPNRSSYLKSKPKKSNRPGTSESNKQLLSKDNPFSSFDDRFTDNHTLIYTHYQHSLNSLNDILDRDDRESLAELHQYLHGAEPTSPPVAFSIHRKLSNASVKPERRRSLPARTSMISLASEFTIAPAKTDPTAFQMRRRRAAKLTQFFGVDYRELISDVLDSIENSVEQEQQRGTLRAEEVEDILDRLRNLKTKRQSFI